MVEKQAMTTSKWELLNNEDDDEEDVDGVEIEETVSFMWIDVYLLWCLNKMSSYLMFHTGFGWYSFFFWLTWTRISSVKLGKDS